MSRDEAEPDPQGLPGLRTNVAILNAQSAVIYSLGYSYDGAGRLQGVTDGTNAAAYSYLAHSMLVEQFGFKNNGTNRMKTTKAYT